MLHFHIPDPPDPEWLKRIEGPIEELMGSLAIFVQAQAFVGKGEEKLRSEMQQVALKQMNVAVKQLAKR